MTILTIEVYVVPFQHMCTHIICQNFAVSTSFESIYSGRKQRRVHFHLQCLSNNASLILSWKECVFECVCPFVSMTLIRTIRIFYMHQLFIDANKAYSSFDFTIFNMLLVHGRRIQGEHYCFYDRHIFLNSMTYIVCVLHSFTVIWVWCLYFLCCTCS